MTFDHEKLLDVYRVALEFVAWCTVTGAVCATTSDVA
jgi:hypothetical protein